MSSEPISSLITPVVSGMHDFCVSPENLTKSRHDNLWVQVPKKGEYYMKGIDECSIDVWGEESCSMNTRFRPITDDGGNPAPIRSCSKAQSGDPAAFNYTRDLIESQPWTLTEMKKAIKWIFNCTGKIPLKACDSNISFFKLT